ncbi:cupin domain-containing protein [Phormidium tenue FACHB-886]|nr:cupin domain-containing protein [Phormidium tenue FACHB-886]
MNPVDLATAEHYTWGGGSPYTSDSPLCDGWHLLKREDLSVIQERVPPGGAEVKHLHQRSRQFFYILSGEATMVIDHKAISLSSSQGIEVPPGVPHQFRNDSAAEVIFLVISAPRSHGDRQTL